VPAAETNPLKIHSLRGLINIVQRPSEYSYQLSKKPIVLS
jgi:hypothetical protein